MMTVNNSVQKGYTLDKTATIHQVITVLSHFSKCPIS